MKKEGEGKAFDIKGSLQRTSRLQHLLSVTAFKRLLW